MSFIKISKKIICNINIFLIYLNFFSFVNCYDSTLLKINYFYDDNNLCYINAFSNSNGDLYFEYFGNNDAKRYFKGLNETTGKNILFKNEKILKINFEYISTHHESMIINYQNNESYIFTFSPEYSEFIDINNPNKVTYKKSNGFIFKNPKDKASYRNKIILLNNNKYLLSIIGKKEEYVVASGGYIYISIFNFTSDNIEGFNRIKGDIEGIAIDYFNTSDCIQTKKGYLECMINDKKNLWTDVLKIYIFDLDFNILGKEYIADVKENTFNQIIYLKDEIGAYIYFDENTPLMQVKYLENEGLNDLFKESSIKLNGNKKYSLSNNIFLSNGIKINDYKLAIAFTSNDLTHILVCIFEMYNDDKSYYLQFFYLDLNKINAKISLNIKTFLFREQIGMALYDVNNKYPGFLIFSYPNINIGEIILFNVDSTNNFSLSENLIIFNNIFGYELKAVYIINYNDIEKSGVLLFSEKNNENIYINEKLNMDDTIIFKEYNNESFPGEYNLELIPIIQEPDFNIFKSLADQTIDNGEVYENFYNPKEFNGKLIILDYIVEENCFYVYHKDKFSKRKICYNGIEDHCIYEEYKYFIDDKNQCIYDNCPSEYFQLNFECYKEGCPSNSIQLQDSNICISEDNYFIIDENYKTQSSNTKFDEYIYSFNNTKQYLKFCNESIKYTTIGLKAYLYNGVCLINCPENTYEDKENEICSCKYYKYNIDEKNYICNSEEEICNDKILVKDINECETSINICVKKGYKIFNNECFANGCPENTIISNNNNNYCKCINLFYINIENNQICSENNYCFEEYPLENKLTHECLKNCEPDKLLNGDCIINIENIETNEIEIITDNIRDVIKKSNFSLNDDIIFKGNNIIYEIKSSENKSFIDNLSFIDFGDCYQKIKDNYNIEFFLILKYDISTKENFSSIVEYEIYHPINKTKLDLSICNNININIYLPSNLDQNIIEQYSELNKYGYNMFNKSDKFYNDICSIFTSKDETDMILSDRRKMFYTDFDKYCGNGCKLTAYDFIIKRKICECKIKNEISSEIKKIEFDKLDYSFFKISTYANFAVLKCYKLTFSKEGQKSNYGSYFIIILTIFIILIMILFYYNYKNQIKEIIDFGLKDIYDINNPPKKIKSNLSKSKSEKKENIEIKKDISKSLSEFKDNNKDSQSKISIYINNKNNININDEKDLKNNDKKIFNYNDEELNSLNYEEALKYDHRNFYKYYVSLLKAKHLILFPFFRKNDFNNFFIKVNLFIFSFSLYFVINALFFIDSTMHKIFEGKGFFNIIIHIPQIIYSTVISIILNKIMKLLALSEGDILKIRKEKNIEKAIELSKKLYSFLKIKFNIFNIFCLLFMIFFWYYISCFCAVYKNTKVIFFEDTFFSFGISIFYPILLYLLPGLFRIKSLKNDKHIRLYKFSYYLSFI